MNSVIGFIHIVWPILLGILGLVFTFRIQDGDVNLAWEKDSFSISTNKKKFVRPIVIIFSLLGLFFPIWRDYSDFFPKRLKTYAYFDNEGIRNVLSDFSKNNFGGLKIKSGWEEDKEHYYEIFNKDLKNQLREDFRFDESANLHSEGETNFRSEKEEGIQKYHLSKVEGFLEHVFEKPGKDTSSFKTEFKLLNTGYNHISIPISDIVFKHSTLIRPEFKQIVGPQKKHYANVVSLTKITFLPLIELGKSLYLVKQDGEEQYVPIGYAIYSPHF